ncbi:MAG: acyltransferase family protein [Marmoricola sp.]
MTTLRSREVERVSEVTARERLDAKPPATRQRDPWFDTIKMALVALVVVGHSWKGLLPANGAITWAYDFLYAWHVPAFVVVTGYLSRNFRWTPEKLWSLVRTVAVPYVIFEAALAWFRYHFGGVALNDLFKDPHWPMWYLAALFFWRLATPAILAIPRRIVLPLAVATSLGAGLFAGQVLDSARIFGLLPFFVLGLVLRDVDWNRLRSATLVPYAVLGFLTIALVTRYTEVWGSTDWFYYNSRYDQLGTDPGHAIALRALVLALGLLGTFSFVVLVPKTASWFSRLGAATLIVYLWHGFLVLSAEYLGVPGWSATHPVVAFGLATAGAVALALTLASPPVARVLKVAVDPIGWLDRRRQQLVEAVTEAPAQTSTADPRSG